MKINSNISRLLSACTAFIMAGLLMTACSDEYEQELGPRPSGSFSVTPLEGEPNTYVLTSDVEDAFRYRWNTGEGWEDGAQTDTAYFEMAGSYPVQMIAMTRNGHVNAEETIEVESNAPGVACTGDPEEVIVGCGESQTWVFSPNEPMNFGGPEANPMEWWSQDLSAQNECMVDDEYIFHADQTFVSNHKGSMWGAGDACVEQPGASTESTWSFFEEDGKTMLDLDDAPLAYDDGDNIYEVVELTADRLHIRKTCCGGGDLNPTRNYVLVPKGTAEEPGEGGEEPEEPGEGGEEPGEGGEEPGDGGEEPGEGGEEQARPLEENDIAVDFEGGDNTTVTEEQWFLDQVAAYELNAANPDPDDVNPSEHVFKYERGTGQWENIQIHLDHKIDLSNRNVFSILVYFPSSNDYSGSLEQAFAVKLQNRELGGDAYTTQEERKTEVEVLDEWVRLTFDFSDVTDREDFDSIVLQPFGEGHNTAGTFYFDEFELLPAE